MDKFSFDSLKNIEVPESWIENALNSPKEKRKYVIPKRFYYFAASAAACVIIGAAVIFSLIFGINKNVDLTEPSPGSPSKADLIAEQTAVTVIISGSIHNRIICDLILQRLACLWNCELPILVPCIIS